MKKYYFYSKMDSSKEPIYTISAINHVMAVRRFAKGKRMDLDTFNKLYEVNTTS